MNIFLNLFLTLVLSLPMISFGAESPGGIGLGATRVIYPANAKQTSLAINNTSPRERYLVNAWVDNERGEKEKNFIITPPLFVSEAKSENTLRIIYVGPPLPTDRESVFWLNVKSIPSVDQDNLAGKNVLQLAILSRIKLFVRPENLSTQPEEGIKQLRFSFVGSELKITNPSPYYASLVNLKVGAKKLTNTMVPPMGSTQVKIPTGVSGAVSFQTVNDYGAVTAVQNGITQ